MNFWKLNRTEEANEEYYLTQSDVKAATKNITPGMRIKAFIDLIEVDTSKEGVLEILRGAQKFKVLKEYGLTARGALKELRF